MNLLMALCAVAAAVETEQKRENYVQTEGGVKELWYEIADRLEALNYKIYRKSLQSYIRPKNDVVLKYYICNVLPNCKPNDMRYSIIIERMIKTAKRFGNERPIIQLHFAVLVQNGIVGVVKTVYPLLRVKREVITDTKNTTIVVDHFGRHYEDAYDFYDNDRYPWGYYACPFLVKYEQNEDRENIWDLRVKNTTVSTWEIDTGTYLSFETSCKIIEMVTLLIESNFFGWFFVFCPALLENVLDEYYHGQITCEGDQRGTCLVLASMAIELVEKFCGVGIAGWVIQMIINGIRTGIAVLMAQEITFYCLYLDQDEILPEISKVFGAWAAFGVHRTIYGRVPFATAQRIIYSLFFCRDFYREMNKMTLPVSFAQFERKIIKEHNFFAEK